MPRWQPFLQLSRKISVAIGPQWRSRSISFAPNSRSYSVSVATPPRLRSNRFHISFTQIRLIYEVEELERLLPLATHVPILKVRKPVDRHLSGSNNTRRGRSTILRGYIARRRWGALLGKLLLKRSWHSRDLLEQMEPELARWHALADAHHSELRVVHQCICRCLLLFFHLVFLHCANSSWVASSWLRLIFAVVSRDNKVVLEFLKAHPSISLALGSAPRMKSLERTTFFTQTPEVAFRCFVFLRIHSLLNLQQNVWLIAPTLPSSARPLNSLTLTQIQAGKLTLLIWIQGSAHKPPLMSNSKIPHHKISHCDIDFTNFNTSKIRPNLAQSWFAKPFFQLRAKKTT